MGMIVVLELDFNGNLIKKGFGVRLGPVEIVRDLGGDMVEVRDGVKSIFELGLIHVDGIWFNKLYGLVNCLNGLNDGFDLLWQL